MGKRKERRTPMRLHVRVWGMDSTGKLFNVPARTMDITPVSARLDGIWQRLVRGAVIGVAHGRSQARFRVSWVGRIGTPNQGQIGIQSLEPGKYIWGMALERTLDQEVEVPLAS